MYSSFKISNLKNLFFIFQSFFKLDVNTGVITTAKILNRDNASLITQSLNVVDINGIKPQTGTGTFEPFIYYYYFY